MVPLPSADLRPSTQLSDPSLLARIRTGDVAAFERLFRTYDLALSRFARRLVEDGDLAEDIVQDVWAWTWDHRETLPGSADILPYLLAAVRHRALEQFRNTRVRRTATNRYVIPGMSPGMAAGDGDGGDLVERNERGTLIWRAVDALGDPRRTILILRWEHAQGWAEIASVVGLTVAAAKMQHSRALVLLRERLPGLFR